MQVLLTRLRVAIGLNNVPIPVSSDSARICRQFRSDRGPLDTQPSFDQLRNAVEPVLAAPQGEGPTLCKAMARCLLQLLRLIVSAA